MDHAVSTFLSGIASRAGFLFFSKELDSLASDDTPNSSFFLYNDNDPEEAFRKYDEIANWPAIAMATIKPAGGNRVVVAIGPYGDYWEVFPASTAETLGKIPGARVNLRRLAAIDDQIFACGMNRVALKRNDTGQWSSFGPGALPGDPAIVGFEDIGGYSEAEMYAVGWGGEIWWRDQGQWRRADSPTNSNLSALTCSSDGNVYIVGHDGTLLKGRRDQWQAVETTRRENLRDVGSFAGAIHVTTDFELFKLTPSGLIAEADFADIDDRPATCLHLLEASDGLISMGQKDVFVKRDGPWRRLV